MIKSNDNKFGKGLCILYPGDFLVTDEDCILSTVIGSCVTVCLFDWKIKIGGMGSFIVPGAIGTEGIIKDRIASRGIYNIELIMAEFIKLGSNRRDLIAKIFGASFLHPDEEQSRIIAESNIRFLNEYFLLEKIHLQRSDLGGDFRRKILFFVKTGKIYRQMLKNNQEESEFIKLESEYVDTEFRDKQKTGAVLIFE